MPHWSELPLTDQIFTHFEEADGFCRTFAASALRRLASAKDAERAGVLHTWIALDEVHVGVLRERHGLEEPRLLRALLTPQYDPLLFVILPDHNALLVDGSHTYVALWMQGLREAPAYLLPECLWRNWLVSGLPETTQEALLDGRFGRWKENS